MTGDIHSLRSWKTTPRALFILLIAATVLAGCALRHTRRLTRKHGEAAARSREVATLTSGAIDYWSQVKPILDARCVVCHGCYDAPCQLKLSSPEGLERGGSKELVYDALRLLQASPSRLFEDAQTAEEWRQRGFHPVVNERDQTLEGNRQAGLMLRLLELKQDHPVQAGLLPEDVDLGLRRDEQCPTTEELPRHMRKHPDWGMPYGLPGLSHQDHEIVVRWLEEGALRVADPDDRASAHAAAVERWEAFLNGDSLEHRLASRYIYEHLFLAHLYFEAGPAGQPPVFFQLVRSKTPPGEPVERIATRRPFDNPRVARPYYRLVPVRESIVAKLHMPYRLDGARMRRWRELFYDADFTVKKLPSYEPEIASNPFASFVALPVESRYRFMLDEAEFTIMGFIKGAVCRGPIALNVIDDHFHISFLDPEVSSRLLDARFLHRNAESLRMPADAGSNALPMVTWVRNAVSQRAYMKAKHDALRADLKGSGGPDLDMIWDGDGHNPNATLTVFRHYDSASVVKGMVGGPPKTSWVLGYPLLERIHYLLVAGFDVYGNVGHQLATRTYMDFLRMEAEFAFLGFLPKEARGRERDFWYRGTSERIRKEVFGQVENIDIESGIAYQTDSPKGELYGLLRERYAPVDEGRYRIEGVGLPEDIVGPLRRLAAVGGWIVEDTPEVAFLYIPDAPEGAQVFSLIHNAEHYNISSPLDESDRRVPSEDTLDVARGFIGTYPNAFYKVSRAELPGFASAVATLKGEVDYAALQERFGVRRTDPDFWRVSDALHAIYRRTRPIEAGLFDLSRIENR